MKRKYSKTGVNEEVLRLQHRLVLIESLIVESLISLEKQGLIPIGSFSKLVGAYQQGRQDLL